MEAAEDAGTVEIEWLPFELRPAPRPLLELRGDHLRVDWTRNVYRAGARAGHRDPPAALPAALDAAPAPRASGPGAGPAARAQARALRGVLLRGRGHRHRPRRSPARPGAPASTRTARSPPPTRRRDARIARDPTRAESARAACRHSLAGRVATGLGGSVAAEPTAARPSSRLGHPGSRLDRRLLASTAVSLRQPAAGAAPASLARDVRSRSSSSRRRRRPRPRARTRAAPSPSPGARSRSSRRPSPGRRTGGPRARRRSPCRSRRRRRPR